MRVTRSSPARRVSVTELSSARALLSSSEIAALAESLTSSIRCRASLAADWRRGMLSRIVLISPSRSATWRSIRMPRGEL